jgi:ribosomal protein S27E
MIGRFLAVIGLRCGHKNITFPQSPRPSRGKRRPAAAAVTGCYVVCTDCGQELPYDWEQMRIMTNREIRKTSRLHVSQESRVN